MKMSNTLIVAHKLYCLFNVITHFVPDLDGNQENHQGKRKLKKENADKERRYLQVPEKKGESNKSTQIMKNRQHSSSRTMTRSRVVFNRDERRRAVRFVSSFDYMRSWMFNNAGARVMIPLTFEPQATFLWANRPTFSTCAKRFHIKTAATQRKRDIKGLTKSTPPSRARRRSIGSQKIKARGKKWASCSPSSPTTISNQVTAAELRNLSPAATSARIWARHPEAETKGPLVRTLSPEVRSKHCSLQRGNASRSPRRAFKGKTLPAVLRWCCPS